MIRGLLAWDVSNVKHMSNMFYSTHFDGDLASWDVSTYIHLNKAFKMTLNIAQ